MKNKLSDLNDHLFAQLERLSDENLTPQKLDGEHKRSMAIVSVADKIIRTASLKLEAAKLIAAHGDAKMRTAHGADPMAALPDLDGRRQISDKRQ